MLIIAVVSVTLALFLYSLGVWAPQKTKTLRPWHVVCLGAGFLLDTTGTSLMAILAGGGFRFTIHGLTGFLANALMLGLTIWSLMILRMPRGQSIYFRWSVILWIIWLIPMILGMVLGGRI